MEKEIKLKLNQAEIEMVLLALENSKDKIQSKNVLNELKSKLTFWVGFYKRVQQIERH